MAVLEVFDPEKAPGAGERQQQTDDQTLAVPALSAGHGPGHGQAAENEDDRVDRAHFRVEELAAELKKLRMTNNGGERGIRKGVMWRKTSFGTQGITGSRYMERMLTVVETLRQQNRNVLDYLTTAGESADRGRPAPSILPHGD